MTRLPAAFMYAMIPCGENAADRIKHNIYSFANQMQKGLYCEKIRTDCFPHIIPPGSGCSHSHILCRLLGKRRSYQFRPLGIRAGIDRELCGLDSHRALH